MLNLPVLYAIIEFKRGLVFMFSKKSAMSTMGYAIVLVIILGVVMIISAPMLMNKYKGDKNSANNDKNYNEERYSDGSDSRQDYDKERDMERYNNDNNINSTEVVEQLRLLEDRMNSRMNNLEAKQSQRPSGQIASDRYVCSIEGNVDNDGNVTPIDGMNLEDVKRKKIVFVCEYNR